jgi:hypothetical protein
MHTISCPSCVVLLKSTPSPKKQELFDGQDGYEPASVDTGTGKDFEDARSEEDACCAHRQDVEAQRRRYAPKGVQPGSIARLASISVRRDGVNSVNYTFWEIRAASAALFLDRKMQRVSLSQK